MSTRPSFFAELKRRNVLRAAVLYAGVVWALAQGIAQFGPSVRAPDWVAPGERACGARMAQLSWLGVNGLTRFMSGTKPVKRFQS